MVKHKIKTTEIQSREDDWISGLSSTAFRITMFKNMWRDYQKTRNIERIIWEEVYEFLRISESELNEAITIIKSEEREKNER